MGLSINFGRSEEKITCDTVEEPTYPGLDPKYIRFEVIPNIVPDKDSFKVIMPDCEVGPFFGEIPKEGEYIILDDGKGILFVSQGSFYICKAAHGNKESQETKVSFKELKPTKIEQVKERKEYIVTGMYKEAQSMYDDAESEKQFLFDEKLSCKSQPFDHLSYTGDGIYEFYLDHSWQDNTAKFVGSWNPNKIEYVVSCFSINGVRYIGSDSYFEPNITQEGFIAGYHLSLKANDFLHNNERLKKAEIDECARRTRVMLLDMKTKGIQPEEPKEEASKNYRRIMIRNGVALNYVVRENEKNEVVQFALCEKRSIDLEKNMFYGKLFGGLVPKKEIGKINLSEDKSFVKTFSINGISFKIAGYLDNYGIVRKECTIEISSDPIFNASGRPYSTYEFENLVTAQFETVMGAINLEYFAPIEVSYVGELSREDRKKQKKRQEGK